MRYLSDALVDNNFTFQFSASAYQNITAGIKAYQKHLLDNKEFYSYNKGKSLYGHLLTYSIERAFYNSAFVPTSKYCVINGKLNEYGYNGLYIKTEDFIINIARTNKKLILPPKAAYKERLAKCNSSVDMQLSLEIQTGNIILNEFKYALITYGYNHDTLTHINLLVPSADYIGSLYKRDILKDASVYSSYTPEAVKEEQIAKLNKELQQALATKNSVGG